MILNHIVKVSIFFLGGLIYAQEIRDSYNFVAVNEDLTQRAITSIFKDNENYLWIATYGDGLFRYNSIDFKSFKQEWNSEESSLSSSTIHSIFQDSQNRIWIGTQRGINLYNRNLDRFEKVGDRFNFPIHTIIEYDEGNLLIGTHQYGLYILDKETFERKYIPYKKGSTANLLINAIVKSPNGRFLVGTNHGVMTFDPYDKMLQLAKFNTKNGYETINKSVESMIVTKDNSIWLGTSKSGLYRLYADIEYFYTIENFSLTKKRILTLAEKSNGIVLCGTENDGLFEVNYGDNIIKNHRHNKLKPNGIKSNSIWSVYTDERNRIWLGYYNNGIDVHDDNYNKFSSLRSLVYQTNSLNSNSVTGIVKDKNGRFWISTLDGGVDVYDPKNETFINLYDQNNPIAKGLNRLDVQTIFIDSKNNVWVGTWNSGLFLLKNDEKKFINIKSSNSNDVFKSNSVMSFAEDSKGTIWIGTFFLGLYSYYPAKKIFIHNDSEEFNKYNISTSNIRKIFVDHEDTIWLGARTGLFRIENKKDFTYSVRSLNDNINEALGNPDMPSIVFSLFEDNKKHLWIGTLGQGLGRYDINTDSLKWYNMNDGLIHETVASITQDESGGLWLGGNLGISKLDIDKDKFTNFSKKDGLLSNSFNYNSVYKDSGNVLYFGNSKGINYFNPDKIIYNKEKPLVYISRLKLSNKSVHPYDEASPLKKVISKTKTLMLNHKQSVFTLEYVGISYTRSENNQYAYYLEGFENEWNYVGDKRSITYTNIPAGTYTFKVKAANSDGVWNETPTTLSIEILNPWWETKTSILIGLLILFLISGFIIRFINGRIKEKQILKGEREERRQEEILNTKKIQFFTNISHEFRTPLTLILNPLEDIIEQKSTQLPEAIKKKHNIIHKNAKRLSRLIDELMDFRKLQFNKMSIKASKIYIIPFITEVVNHFEEEALQNNIILSVEHEEINLLNIWVDPSMLEKIIFNLLSNAFKAIHEEGMVTLQIKKLESVLLPLVDKKKEIPAVEITIKDTGVGIKKENIDKVFDRFYQDSEIDKQHYSGTGIGLEVVRNFVNLHKGKIELQSEENIGTEFRIYFPFGNSHLEESSVDKTKKAKIDKKTQNKKTNLKTTQNHKETFNKKLILIVEDNNELRTYLKNELEEEYNVKVAENGKRGLEKADKFIPDIIITDVMMPFMDGFEFCERIKSDIKTSHIPILMITAKGMQIDKVKGIDSGADVYLNKPFNMKILRSHLKQLITTRQILFNKYFKGIDDISGNTTSLDKEFMNNVLNYINENISDEELNVENLAGKLLLSRSKLYRKIKALTGNTANEFIRKIRLEKAKQLIENSEYTISEICYKIGFSSPSYFTKCFKDYFGVLPTEIRKK